MAGWEDKLRKVAPYVPGEQPQGKDVIKLNTNENPYPPSPKVAEAIRNANLDTAMRKYPDPEASVLVRALAGYYGVMPEQIFVGMGSDDVLATAFMSFFNGEEPIVFPDVTYSFYPVWARMFGIPYREIPLSEDGFQICPDDYTDNGGVVIANPNAPTGIRLPRPDVEKILKANPNVIVIVDEAYVDYTDDSALPLLDTYENLVIVRTFSKSRAMAGMRIGFAIASPRLIRVMNNVAQSINSYTKTSLSITAAVASISDEEYFRARIEDVRRTRAKTVMELKKRGFSVLPSSANFVFTTPSWTTGRELYEGLRERDIYVRIFKNNERIRDYLRITIGTEDEMETLFGAIDEMKLETAHA